MVHNFLYKRTAQFAETDMAGIVHFANYFRFMEEAEHAFWRSIGYSVVMEHAGLRIGFPRVKVECEYKSPLLFEESFCIRVIPGRIGEKSIRFSFEFVRSDETTLVATGTMTVVCVEFAASGEMKSMLIPSDIRAALEQ